TAVPTAPATPHATPNPTAAPTELPTPAPQPDVCSSGGTPVIRENGKHVRLEYATVLSLEGDVLLVEVGRTVTVLRLTALTVVTGNLSAATLVRAEGHREVDGRVTADLAEVLRPDSAAFGSRLRFSAARPGGSGRKHLPRPGEKRPPKEKQRRSDGAALGGLAALVEGVGDAVGADFAGDSDVHRAWGLALDLVVAGDAGDADAVVGVEVAAGGGGHGAGDFSADDAVLLDDVGADAQAHLHLCGVGDVPALVVLGSARHVGNRRGEKSRGAGLHGCQSEAAGVKHVAHDALERVVVGAPDNRAENAAGLLLDGGDEDPGRFLGVRLGGEADVDS